MYVGGEGGKERKGGCVTTNCCCSRFRFFGTPAPAADRGRPVDTEAGRRAAGTVTRGAASTDTADMAPSSSVGTCMCVREGEEDEPTTAQMR